MDKTKWPSVKYEELAWHSKYGNGGLTRRQKSAIVPKYDAAVPNYIADFEISVSKDIQNMLDDALMVMSRFDTFINQKDYNLPAILLRSESASSSQIERLTASARNIALAELSDKAPENSKLVASNILAMKMAIEKAGDLSLSTIRELHRLLMQDSNNDIAGKFRTEQVWIGGSGFGPGGAEFIPPHHSRIAALLEDFVAFSRRDDLNFIAKSAVAHAQFETIHPFSDGNGRTGRALIQISLHQDEALLNTTLPISAGLLHNVEGYFAALNAYHEGDIAPIILETCEAVSNAVMIGRMLSEKLDLILQDWRSRVKAMKNNSIWRLFNLLIEQPVVDAKYIYTNLGITERSAGNVIELAQNTGILHKIGNKHKGVFYEAKAITALLDDVSTMDNLRRLAAGA
jgi:Fic family protein